MQDLGDLLGRSIVGRTGATILVIRITRLLTKSSLTLQVVSFGLLLGPLKSDTSSANLSAAFCVSKAGGPLYSP